MRTLVAAIILCLLALSALGAHHAEPLLTPVLPAAQNLRPHEDIYSSQASLRHRAARPSHWIAHVLMPQK
jgi:hypothetical protein